jgi:DNA invertase Pin-like site-specific DNA recombinase
MKCAIYCRVSTRDQSVEMQLVQLREYAQRRGWEIADEYVDEAVSGIKKRRPGLDRLMADCQQRLVDVVLVWKFDRFARSVTHLTQALETFQALGVDFVSYSQNLDTSTPMGKMLFVIVGAVGELERDLIRERTEAGRQVARGRGVKFGRRSVVTPEVRDRIFALRKGGQTFAYISNLLGIGEATVARTLALGRSE